MRGRGACSEAQRPWHPQTHFLEPIVDIRVRNQFSGMEVCAHIVHDILK